MSKSPTPRHWLMKTEPEVYSLGDLARDRTTLWEGVRNYQARNFMMNDMAIGDEVLIYHSNAEPPGIAGRATVSGRAVPDPSARSSTSPYFDPKATSERPIWYCVEVKFAAELPRLLSLEEIRQCAALKNMLLLKRGMRLSIQPVTPMEFEAILKLAGSSAQPPAKPAAARTGAKAPRGRGAARGQRGSRGPRAAR